MGVWIKFGAGIAIPLMLGLMAYVIETKGLASAEAAGWAQAIGASAAVFAAFWIGNSQARREARSKAEMIKAKRLVAFELIEVLSGTAVNAHNMLKGGDRILVRLKHHAVAIGEALEFAREFNPSELEDISLMRTFTRAVRSAAIGHDALKELQTAFAEGDIPPEKWEEVTNTVSDRVNLLRQRKVDYRKRADELARYLATAE